MTSASAFFSFCAAPTPANPPPRISDTRAFVIGHLDLPLLQAAARSPSARGRFARLETDQRLAATERVGRTGHGLDGDAAPVDVGERIAGEDHQVRGSSRRPRASARSRSGPRSSTRARPSASRSSWCTRCRASSRRSVCPARSRSRFPRPASSDREATLVGEQTLSAPAPAVVAASTVWSRVSGTGARRSRRDRAPCRRWGSRRHREPVLRHRVLDGQRKRERVARLRMEQVVQHDTVGSRSTTVPLGPANEAMNCVPVLRLRQRELIRLPSNS